MRQRPLGFFGDALVGGFLPTNGDEAEAALNAQLMSSMMPLIVIEAGPAESLAGQIHH
jgi:hypothetical protein